MHVKIVWSPVLEIGNTKELSKAATSSQAAPQSVVGQRSAGKKSNMRFEAEMAGHTIEMDARAPVGGDNGATPKHLLLSAICGCTAMDVVSLMRKHRQELEAFEVEADAEATTGHPAVFRDIFLKFHAKGQIEKEKLLEAINLSQTKYCGVSAMVSKACRLMWEATLNGEKIGNGKAQFDDLQPI